MALDPETKRTGVGGVVWLETGNSGAGWKHILQRHENEFYDLPSVSNREDIKEIIHKTVKEARLHPLLLYRKKQDTRANGLRGSQQFPHRLSLCFS